MDKSIVTVSRSLVKDTRGANLVEYILLVGLVAVIAIAGFKFFGEKVTNKIEVQGNTVQGIPDKPGN